jgi:hypothetical protein
MHVVSRGNSQNSVTAINVSTITLTVLLGLCYIQLSLGTNVK